MTKVSIARVSPLARRLGISLGLGLGILVIGAIAPPPAPLSAVADTETLASLGGDRLVQAQDLRTEHGFSRLHDPPGCRHPPYQGGQGGS
jgi:hypothetical protein